MLPYHQASRIESEFGAEERARSGNVNYFIPAVAQVAFMPIRLPGLHMAWLGVKTAGWLLIRFIQIAAIIISEEASHLSSHPVAAHTFVSA